MARALEPVGPAPERQLAARLTGRRWDQLTIALGGAGSAGYLIGFVGFYGRAWTDAAVATPSHRGLLLIAVPGACLLAHGCLLAWRWGLTHTPVAGTLFGRLGLAYRITVVWGLIWLALHGWAIWPSQHYTPAADSAWLGLWVGQPFGAAAASLGSTALAFHLACSAGLWLESAVDAVHRLVVGIVWCVAGLVWLAAIHVLARLATGAALWGLP